MPTVKTVKLKTPSQLEKEFATNEYGELVNHKGEEMFVNDARPERAYETLYAAVSQNAVYYTLIPLTDDRELMTVEEFGTTHKDLLIEVPQEPLSPGDIVEFLPPRVCNCLLAAYNDDYEKWARASTEANPLHTEPQYEVMAANTQNVQLKHFGWALRAAVTKSKQGGVSLI